jgi:hypothetical protein
MKTFFFYLTLCALLVSCGLRREEVVGVYTVRNQANNWDTLHILTNGTYVRHLRSKHNAFVYSQTDKWDFGDGRLTLDHFVPDEDQRYEPTANLQDVGITSSLPVEKKSGAVVIYYRLDSDNFFYEKL